MAKLSDNQSIPLARGAQRDGGSLCPPLPSLVANGAVMTKAVVALMKQSFSAKCEAGARDAAYRSHGDLHYGAVVNTAGVAAIGIDVEMGQVSSAVGALAPAAPAAPAKAAAAPPRAI